MTKRDTTKGVAMKDWKFIQVGNASFKDVIWTVEDEDGSGSDFQSEAIAYATARKWARESGEPVNIFKTELDENGKPKGQPKFVKTVNKSHALNKDTDELREKLRDIDELIKNWEHAKSINGMDEKKAQKIIDGLRKEKSQIQREIATGNESIDKQEWSMFKGLTKKAEEEVGNEDIPTEQDLKNWIRMSQQDMKDAQREMEKNKPLGHPDSYREEKYGRAKVKYDEAAKAIKKMEEELRQGKYKKVGNSKVGNEYKPDIRITPADLSRKLKQAKNISEIDDIDDEIEYDLREYENAIDECKLKIKDYERSMSALRMIQRDVSDARRNLKVGNARSKEQLLADVRELTKYIKDNPDRPCEKEKRLLGEAKEELDKRYGVIVGNFKTGKSKLSVGDKVSLYGVKGTVKGITGENSDNIYGEPVIEFESEDGKTKQVPEHYLVKVGNADTVSEYNAEIQRLTKKAEQLRRMGQGRSAMEIEKQIEKLGKELRELGNKKTGNAGQWNSTKTIYGKWDDKAGRPAEEYARITWLGQGKGGLVNIWRGNQMTSEKYGSNDLEDLRRWAEQRIGNETLGQWAKAKPRIINGTWEEPRKMPFQEKSLRYAYEKAKSKGLSGKKLEDEMLRIVSTTPHESSANEQEKRNDVNKWILLNGESSDFVNNLHRARNAMAKNKQITLWDGNDSVLISEDGTVQYLESNSFEVDRGKYDSQQKAVEELTKQGYRKK